ncbi:MAG: sulfatase-like hydrolase/transferase [Planctomycetota bacterium]
MQSPYFYNVPHYPYQGHAKWLKRYEKLPYPRNLYAAFLSTMDEYIGKLLAKVNALGLREDTIVIFQSDHGHSHEERAHRSGGNSGPYRGAKFSLFEGGIRVPAIISWPGTLPAGQVLGQVGHGCDWLPTIAALCGAPLLQKNIDGRSLESLVRGQTKQSPHDVLHWTFGNSWAVRDGEWKLIANPRDTSLRGKIPKGTKRWLSKLDRDVTEMKNFAAEHPEVVKRLEALHSKWARSVPK